MSLELRIKIAKDYIKEIKSYGCLKCGSKNNLHFHHIIPRTEKHLTISSMVSKGQLLSTIIKELKKCKLLCHSCHAKEHKIINNIPENKMFGRPKSNPKKLQYL